MSELKSLGKIVEYMKDKLDQIAEAIVGDPTTDNKPGIIVRLDRLERSSASHRRVLAIFAGGSITVIGTTIAALVLRII